MRLSAGVGAGLGWAVMTLALLPTTTAGQAVAAPASTITIAPFDQQVPPPPPDYAQPAAWAARPGAPGTSAQVPPGASPAAHAAMVDVFYVYPTTFRSKDRWNADIADAETNHWTDISVVARQASVFNACCRVIAPRYRQASLAAFSSPVDGAKAYALAYADVLRAFDHYLAHDNKGRPFILAGHSQGSLMIKRLLAERIKGTAVARRLIAAYILGIGLSHGEFADGTMGVPACADPGQTGCVIGWNSFVEGSDTAAYRARSTAAYRAAHGDTGAEMLCVDPLRLGGIAPSSGHALGALPGEASDGALPALVPAAVATRCMDGVLMVQPAATLGLTPLPGGNMHYHDMALYYADIRADAVRRTQSFLAQGRHP